MVYAFFVQVVLFFLLTLCNSALDPLGNISLDLSRFENGVVSHISEKLLGAKHGSLQLDIKVDILDH